MLWRVKLTNLKRNYFTELERGLYNRDRPYSTTFLLHRILQTSHPNHAFTVTELLHRVLFALPLQA